MKRPWRFSSILAAIILSIVPVSHGGQGAPQAKTPTRRALLVPIGAYPRPNVGASTRDSASADPIEIFRPLLGPPNDAKALRALLIARYGFKEQNVHTLSPAEATHDGILRAIQRFLVDEAAPGDECFFYYSGHGSFIVNSKSVQGNNQEETIVPIDYVRPVTRREEIRDIRDRELAHCFNRALDKGVVLTALFDSCHSGSIARGGATVKAGPSITFDIAEPPSGERAPTDRGALIMSAALAEEQAIERMHGEDKAVHGDFTFALLEALKRPDAETLSAEQTFQRIAALMKGVVGAAQPNLDAKPDRRARGLFGTRLSGSGGRVQYVVDEVKNGGVILNKGQAYGVTEGSELVGKSGAPPVRLRITRVPDMTSSIATPIRPSTLAGIKKGDIFLQDRWAASPRDIRIWVPDATLGQADLQGLAKEAAALRASRAFQVISDPARESFTHRLFLDGTSWRLAQPSGAVLDLGPEASARVLREKAGLGADARLFISLPLSREQRASLVLGPGTEKNAVKLSEDEGSAIYSLVGRPAEDGRIEYAWILNRALRVDAEGERKNAGAGNGGRSKPSPLPVITDWVAAGDRADSFQAAARQLEDLVLRLNKLHGWITLASLPEAGTAENRFPYRLVIQTVDGSPIRERDRLVEDEHYQLRLVADPKELGTRANLSPHWVYVFTIDGRGESTLLYPQDGGVGNDFPKKDRASSISLGRFEILGPRRGGVVGPETYILLTTRQRLLEPNALVFDGVVHSSGETRGEGSPLEGLLREIGVETRSVRSVAVPANWTVQHLFLQSVAKP